MTERSEQSGAGDLTAWCLRELEEMLAEQVRLLRADTPVKPEDRPKHIRRIKDLTVATRMLAVAKGAMARAAGALDRVATERAAMTPGRGGRADAAEHGDEHWANDHNLEQRQAAINARFAAMAPGPHGGGTERDGLCRDERDGAVLAVAGA
ncbi:hypothetical protein [Brevundimonas sp.]|uniref:hypothetical protein n=1 Tax=Brevundimonas sp. TaxID=1871086 RepID=UPI00391C20B7